MDCPIYRWHLPSPFALPLRLAIRDPVNFSCSDCLFPLQYIKPYFRLWHLHFAGASLLAATLTHQSLGIDLVLLCQSVTSNAEWRALSDSCASPSAMLTASCLLLYLCSWFAEGQWRRVSAQRDEDAVQHGRTGICVCCSELSQQVASVLYAHCHLLFASLEETLPAMLDVWKSARLSCAHAAYLYAAA